MRTYIKEHELFGKTLFAEHGDISLGIPLEFGLRISYLSYKGGGNLIIKLFNATESEELADTDVVVSIDGVKHTFPAGTEVCIKSGESITLTPYLYHRFWGEKGKGKVLVQEVSMCNDDANDNHFYDKVGRFPEIDEDEAPLHLSVTNTINR